MKIKIDIKEWYPVYEIDNDEGIECEVPQETLIRWERISEEFDTMQGEMAFFCKKYKNKI